MPEIVKRGYLSRCLARDKVNYLLSCFATELVHRCLGVFCTVLRRYARGGRARILAQMPRARQRITYLLSCFATELVHRCLGVFCKVFTSVSWGKWYILRRHARGNKARILEQMPRARRRITYLLSCFATELVHRCLGVFCTVFTSVY